MYGIVKQSAGYLYVYSEPGHGTTFRVYFPRVEDAIAATPPPVQARMLKGTETILLVEDQAELRAVARTILESAGYTVLEAATEAEARAVAERSSQRIHLLITDMVLPDGNGPQVASQVKTFQPDVRVLHVSGYADDVLMHGRLKQGSHFLQKPFSGQTLLTKVRAILDASS